MMNKGFLTVKEFAQKTGYSERRIRQMAAGKKIHAKKVGKGRKWLIPISELEIRQTQAGLIEDTVDPRLTKHFDELTKVAQNDYYSIQEMRARIMLNEKSANINPRIKQINEILYSPKSQHQIQEVDSYVRECLNAHLVDKLLSYRESGLTSKDDLLRQLSEGLLLMSHSENYRVCPTCPGCAAIMGYSRPRVSLTRSVVYKNFMSKRQLPPIATILKPL
jgi:excisionase family DNA binding protein